MVSMDDPHSRAGSLALVGGELALDFTNTASGRGVSTHRDHLLSAADIVAWARHANAIHSDDADWLATATRRDKDLGRELLEAALALREDIHTIVSDVAAESPAPPKIVESLTRTHARALARAKLTRFGAHYAWSWSVASSPIEAVLGPISLSALTILCQADLTRVKQCQGEKCGWLFLDTTKNKSRRWCEMEICGNRAKQKRFGAKACDE